MPGYATCQQELLEHPGNTTLELLTWLQLPNTAATRQLVAAAERQQLQQVLAWTGDTQADLADHVDRHVL